MTIHKTDAYNSGLMPDYTVPGVLLCRTCKFVAEDDTVVSGDTIYLMQLPDGAMILNVVINVPAAMLTLNHIDVGYGEDDDEFFTQLSCQTACTVSMVSHGTGDVVMGAAGAINLVLTNDEILIAEINAMHAGSAETKMPTNFEIDFNVFYKMTGVIEDED